jgi:pimeloyl-ACP methyl ester carboxylesterase
MRVAVEDVKRVVAEARKQSRQVVPGGHSLGGSIATAYATRDIEGRAGGADLSGLVFVDGRKRAGLDHPAEATVALEERVDGSPWLGSCLDRLVRTCLGGAPLLVNMSSAYAAIKHQGKSQQRKWLRPFLFGPLGLDRASEAMLLAGSARPLLLSGFGFWFAGDRAA